MVKNGSLKKFIKVGVAAGLMALSVGAMAEPENSNSPLTDTVHTEKVNHTIQNIQNRFNVDKFQSHYHLELTNIHIRPVYLKAGLNLDWESTVTQGQADQTVDIIVPLDAKGNLYGIDKHFNGSLSQEEKKLLLEQTVLHEVVHAYSLLGKNKFQASDLSVSANFSINQALTGRFIRNNFKNLFEENLAEVGSGALLIKYNQDNLNTVVNLLQKIHKNEVGKKAELLADNSFDPHMDMLTAEKYVLNHSHQFKDMPQEKILNLSQKVASDTTLDFVKNYGRQFKLPENLFNDKISTAFIRASLKDIVHNNSQLKGYNYHPYYQAAEIIAQKYPDVGLNGNSVPYISSHDTPEQTILKESAGIDHIINGSLFIRRDYRQINPIDSDIELAAKKLTENPHFITAQKIINDYSSNKEYNKGDYNNKAEPVTKINSKALVLKNIHSLRTGTDTHKLGLKM